MALALPISLSLFDPFSPSVDLFINQLAYYDDVPFPTFIQESASVFHPITFIFECIGVTLINKRVLQF